MNDLEHWLHTQLPRLAAKTPLAGAIPYSATRLQHLRPYLEHRFLELGNNVIERALRTIYLGRENYLFMGSAAAGKATSIAHTLIQTATMSGLDPQAWLTEVLHRISERPSNRIHELLRRTCKHYPTQSEHAWAGSPYAHCACAQGRPTRTSSIRLWPPPCSRRIP